jgi:uncharacterized protein
MKKFSWILLVFSTFAFCQKYTFPEPLGYVNDFEKVFSKEENDELHRIIGEFELETSNEIAVVSVEGIGNYNDFDKYALDLSNYYGAGKKGKDNGLTIVFSKNLRKISIHTGTGTEKILTDRICKDIMNESILPEFKKQHYFLGIKTALFEFIEKWNKR